MQIKLRERILFIILYLFASNAIGQSKGGDTEIFELISEERFTANFREKVRKAVHYRIDITEFRKIVRDKKDDFFIEIPLPEGTFSFLMHQVNLTSPDYRVLTEFNHVNDISKQLKFFRGSSIDKSNTRIGITLMENEVHIMVYSKNGSFQISKLIGDEIYSGVYTEDELNQKPFVCHTDTEIPKNETERIDINTRNSLECVEVYLEIDNKAFVENGGNTNAVETWALALMNQVALFYDEINIPLVVSGIKMYTNLDPYSVEVNASDALSAFRDSMANQGFDGTLAHLLVGRNIGGGIAYLNVLCSPFNNVAVSGNLNPGQINYGTYSWNINVIAHEIGHNFGSLHTHDCAWNGNNSQIDDCGNLYWSNENKPENIGQCYDEENKILPGNQGTIMSYCHAVGNGQSINLNNGFHPQVRERIYSGYVQSGCGGQQECNGVPPGNDLCIDAIPLTPGNGCIPAVYDVSYATENTAILYFDCGNPNPLKDIWFSVEIPQTGVLTVETKDVQNGLNDMVLEIFTGDCTDLNFYACDDDSGDNLHAKIEINDQALGSQYVYIRVSEKNGTNGDFGICAHSEDVPCQDEVEYLIELYNATNGANWTNNDGWSAGAAELDCNHCAWFGITCNAESKVVAIALPGNNLNGTLPLSLANLVFLENFSLPSNSLSGGIPDLFIGMNNLKTINLSDNNLTGELPPSIAESSTLIELALADNDIAGSLPAFINPRIIQSLYLQNNEFSNCIPFNYYFFCANPNVDLSGNLNLPFSGNLGPFCNDWTGTDFDGDGFCYNLNDCDDSNSNINPGMPELCDGLDNNCNYNIDEGLNNGPNIWSGSGTSSYMDAENWSLGHVPLGCEDVEIGLDASTNFIEVNLNQQEIQLSMRSLQIGPNTTITFGQGSYPNFMGGSIINHGNLTFNGGFYMNWLYGFVQHQIQNSGTITIGQNTYNQINTNGYSSFKNNPGGIINNHGNIFIWMDQGSYGLGAIINGGLFTNERYINVSGTPVGPVLKIESNGTWHNKGENAIFEVGGEIEGGSR